MPVSIESWNEALNEIQNLQNTINENQRKIKEIESHTTEYVDNPRNIINKDIQVSDSAMVYVPVLNDRRHYTIKLEELKRHFDDFHLPLFYNDEQSVFAFDSVIVFLNDLIRFKNTYDFSGIVKPSVTNPAYYVYLDTKNNVFQFDQTSNRQMTTIYFSTLEIAKKCCTWLNYKYKKGPYQGR